MTDLNLAYSNNDDIDEDFITSPQIKEKEKDNRDLIYQQQIQQSQQQAPQQAQQQQKQILPPPQLRMRNNTENFSNQQQYYNRYPEYSFWDRMIMSKREVLKLFILSIVIILGTSLEKIGYHYISTYISSNDLTTFQELMVRLAFPIVVFIILWIIKSL